jgi:hypothetical protein
MMCGVSEARTLWITSIALYLGALALIWIRIYSIEHAYDHQEKLETALYKALEESVPRSGTDASSRIAVQSREKKGPR